MQTEVPFTGQPYRFKDDDPKMQETLDSVKKRGVRAPGLVRPDPDGGYEIISGHRRHRASELAGLEDMPVIIRDMTDEEAVILTLFRWKKKTAICLNCILRRPWMTAPISLLRAAIIQWTQHQGTILKRPFFRWRPNEGIYRLKATMWRLYIQ